MVYQAQCGIWQGVFDFVQLAYSTLWLLLQLGKVYSGKFKIT